MRIIGVNIPDDKKLGVSLTYIFGVGKRTASSVLQKAGVDQDKRAKDLTGEEVNKIQKVFDGSYTLEGELRQQVRSNVKRLKNSGTYRGVRHTRQLPTRGQRTKSNSRTVRGNVRKTAGSGRRKTELK